MARTNSIDFATTLKVRVDTEFRHVKVTVKGYRATMEGTHEDLFEVRKYLVSLARLAEDRVFTRRELFGLGAAELYRIAQRFPIAAY